MKTKYFAEFFVDGVEQCGSDSVFILDGRNNIETMINDAYERMERLKPVQPHYNGFNICRGTFSKHTILHSNK